MTNPTPDPRLVEADVIEAVQQALARHETSFISKCVVLVETSTVDGQKGIWTFTHDGATTWDVIGMLQYGIELEKETLHD